MDNRPIGVFDSGLGGLTCVTHLLKAMPNESVVYFGDTARTPYGSKSVQTIKQFSREIVDFLLEQDCKAIMIACNTVSATCIDDLRQAYPDMTIIGIIEPMVQNLTQAYQENPAISSGVIGTKVTIESGVYPELFAKKVPGFNLKSKACPLFVPLIEEGLANHEMMDMAIGYYLDDFLEAENLQDLILGCTHYHLLEEKLQSRYPELNLHNPAKAQVEALRIALEQADLLADDRSNSTEFLGENIFYASDLSGNFRNMIAEIIKDEEAQIKFKNLAI